MRLTRFGKPSLLRQCQRLMELVRLMELMRLMGLIRLMRLIRLMGLMRPVSFAMRNLNLRSLMGPRLWAGCVVWGSPR